MTAVQSRTVDSRAVTAAVGLITAQQIVLLSPTVQLPYRIETAASQLSCSAAAAAALVGWLAAVAQ